MNLPFLYNHQHCTLETVTVTTLSENGNRMLVNLDSNWLTK